MSCISKDIQVYKYFGIKTKAAFVAVREAEQVISRGQPQSNEKSSNQNPILFIDNEQNH